ncbi:histidine phosphatase family protein [bacterium]|nr:histidine phosphatase family protein [bacterium]
MFKRKCKIIFIAHGSTIYSEENRVSDKLDYPPLNESGYEEIEKICEFIKKRGLKLNGVYSSPSLCCVQSAEIIAEAIRQEVVVIPSLINRKCGILSGLTFEQIEKKHPDLLEELHKNPLSFCPKGGEEVQIFNERIRDVLSDLIKQNLDGRIIVVTHPSIIQSAIRNALSIPPEHQYKMHIRPASATQISYFKDWASLVYSNYTPL